MLLLLTHLVCQVCSNMFVYTKVPPFRLLIVVARSVPSDLFLTVPNNQFAFYPASLGQQAGWRNFRHISRKIFKKNNKKKKSSLGLGKIIQPKQRGKYTSRTNPPARDRDSGACCFLVLPGRQGQAM